MAIICTAMAMAQLTGLVPPSQTADVLGAHLGYGRGCVMCHAPHSGAHGNGIQSLDPGTGDVALWGQDLQPLYGQVIKFGSSTYSVTLPGTAGTYSASNITSSTDGAFTVLLCLSCHDGNLATVAMMKNTTVEALPIVAGGTAHAPTLLGNDGSSAGNYLNDHPVGSSATFGCGGASAHQWDCTISNTANFNAVAGMVGTASSVFFNTNYGFSVSLTETAGVYNTVTCTSCHNQHSMNAFAATASNGKMGATPTSYSTMFFIKGPYQPTSGGNNVAQFCRQCHGGESNESAGVMQVVTN